MPVYHAFYRSKKIELTAKSSYDAQEAAAKQLKAKKSYEVTVVLVGYEDGTEVIHHTGEL